MTDRDFSKMTDLGLEVSGTLMKEERGNGYGYDEKLNKAGKNELMAEAKGNKLEENQEMMTNEDGKEGVDTCV